MRRLGLIFVCANVGCILPISTGAPLPATTVGQGRVGVAVSGEAPVLDLIAEDRDGTSGAVSYGAAPAAAASLTVSYGLGEHTDLEVSGEGALYYFLLPLPTGGAIGLRHHIEAGDDVDIGIAARVGRVGSTDEGTNAAGDTVEYGASAVYGALQAVVQRRYGAVRPLAALNIMPARISRTFTDAPADTFTGLASSATFGVMFVGRAVTAGPYITGTNFYSGRFDNAGWFVSGGVALALRPDRNRRREPPLPSYPPVSAPPGEPVDAPLPAAPPPVEPAPAPPIAPAPPPA